VRFYTAGRVPNGVTVGVSAGLTTFGLSNVTMSTPVPSTKLRLRMLAMVPDGKKAPERPSKTRSR
jgi:hypothetical protein